MVSPGRKVNVVFSKEKSLPAEKEAYHAYSSDDQIDLWICGVRLHKR